MSYAALNRQFALPSPPPRSVFSTVRSLSGRAWFPDFTKEQDPVASLETFIRSLFYPVLRQSTFVQLKVLIALIAIIGISIFLIILRRLYERSFWLFRLVHRSNGTLIVPNAITAFVAIESLFVILLITLCAEVIAWFQYGHSPKHMILWIGLTWLPLILGAWCTTVGIIYARPDALSFVSPQPGKPHSWALRMGITPSVVNLFVFCIPVVQIVSVIVPVVLAQQHFGQAFEHYHRWSAALDTQAALTREVLLEAQQIWFRVLDAAYYISVCMAIWEAWVCALFICYCLAGSSLIATLRDQLKTLRSFKQNRSFSESFVEQNGNKKVACPGRISDAPLAVIVLGAADQADVDAEKQLPSPLGAGLLSAQAPVRSLSVSSALSDSATLVTGEIGLKRSGSLNGPAKALLHPSASRTGPDVEENNEAQTESIYFTREELKNHDQPSYSFFPPVRPSAFERPIQAQTPAGKQNSHKRYLEKFYRNFVVQSSGLLLCILFFAIFCGKLITTWYSAWEANKLAVAFQTAMLVVCWVTVVLAGVIIFAILSRTYEPLLSNFSATTHSSSSDNRHANQARSNKEASPRSAGRRLSGGRSWVASTLSQLSSGEDRRSQDIGLDPVRSSRRHSRAGSLSAVGRSSLHAYAELDGEQASPITERPSASLKSQPLTLRRSTVSTTPDLQASSHSPSLLHEPRKQRPLRASSVSNSANKSSKGGVMVEQTVSTIVEVPGVEEYYWVERPPMVARPSPCRSDTSEDELFTPHTLDFEPCTPAQFGRRSEWADNLATPSSMTSLGKRRDTQGSGSWRLQRSQDVATAKGEQWALQRSRSDLALQSSRVRPSTAGDDSVGLGIAMAETTPWTAPRVWGSGEPDPVLMQEDAEMRLRMASRPGAGTTKRA